MQTTATTMTGKGFVLLLQKLIGLKSPPALLESTMDCVNRKNKQIKRLMVLQFLLGKLTDVGPENLNGQ